MMPDYVYFVKGIFVLAFEKIQKMVD